MDKKIDIYVTSPESTAAKTRLVTVNARYDKTRDTYELASRTGHIIKTRLEEYKKAKGLRSACVYVGSGVRAVVRDSCYGISCALATEDDVIRKPEA